MKVFALFFLVLIASVLAQDETACGDNEEYSLCNGDCQATCDDPQPICYGICKSGCVCTAGFIRQVDDGPCIAYDEC